MKYPLKLIEWTDAFGDADAKWLDLDTLEPPTPLIVHSVGYEVTRENDQVTLCQSVNDSGRGGGFVTIPVGMIRREKTLRARL